MAVTPITPTIPTMPGDSFTFNDKNSYVDFGIKVIKTDAIFPPKRDRKQVIPRRNGFYDYGAKWFGERVITLDCATETRQISSRADTRECAYWLSRKGRLFLWDEPDKYYLGECINGADIFVLPKYCKQQFTLTFVCQPFAVGRRVIMPVTSGNTDIDYAGTAETPTLFVLRNDTGADVNGVKLTLTRRKAEIR